MRAQWPVSGPLVAMPHHCRTSGDPGGSGSSGQIAWSFQRQSSRVLTPVHERPETQRSLFGCWSSSHSVPDTGSAPFYLVSRDPERWVAAEASRILPQRSLCPQHNRETEALGSPAFDCNKQQIYIYRRGQARNSVLTVGGRA